MNIRNLVRTLTVAALLAVTVVTVSAQQADAKPIREKQTHGPTRPVGWNGAKCAMPGYAVNQPQYDWVFYNPADVITIGTVEYMCNTSGNWQHF